LLIYYLGMNGALRSAFASPNVRSLAAAACAAAQELRLALIPPRGA
jgi:hypothetical protein